MSEKRDSSSRSRRGGCGCGCGGLILVLTLGIVLSLFHAVIGVGVSIRIPFTPANLTGAIAIGTKSEVAEAMPGYTQGRLGSNQDFVNHSQLLTIGPAEGATVLVIGEQKGAPAVDLHLVAR